MASPALAETLFIPGDASPADGLRALIVHHLKRTLGDGTVALSVSQAELLEHHLARLTSYAQKIIYTFACTISQRQDSQEEQEQPSQHETHLGRAQGWQSGQRGLPGQLQNPENNEQHARPDGYSFQRQQMEQQRQHLGQRQPIEQQRSQCEQQQHPQRQLERHEQLLPGASPCVSSSSSSSTRCSPGTDGRAVAANHGSAAGQKSSKKALKLNDDELMSLYRIAQDEAGIEADWRGIQDPVPRRRAGDFRHDVLRGDAPGPGVSHILGSWGPALGAGASTTLNAMALTAAAVAAAVGVSFPRDSVLEEGMCCRTPADTRIESSEACVGAAPGDAAATPSVVPAVPAVVMESWADAGVAGSPVATGGG